MFSGVVLRELGVCSVELERMIVFYVFGWLLISICVRNEF